MTAVTGRPTVVVVGAGFGGMAAAKALKDAPVRTVLLDRHNYHLFAPLIYQVSTALLDPSDVAEPVRRELRRVKNCEFRQATVTGFDLAAKKVETDVGVVGYDYLVVATGSQTNFMGNESLQRNALGMKTLTDAIRMRGEVLARFEAAAWVEDGDERRRLLSFVVAGGGSTGVETAGALAELCHHVLRRDFRNVDHRDVTITLLEGSPNVLAPYHADLQRKAQRHLERLGVRVRRSTRVAEVHERHVVLTDGSSLPASVVVWTAGVCGSDAGSMLTTDLGPGNRVPVGPGCNLLGHDDVFVVGDTADFPGADGRPLPMLAPVATQQARHVARTIRAAVVGEAHPGSFRYRDKGFMSTIGRGGAVVQLPHLRMSGAVAWLTWMAVHLALIKSVQSQLSILGNWVWHIFSRDRHARAIYDAGDVPPSPAQLAPVRRAPRRPRRAAREAEDARRAEASRRRAQARREAAQRRAAEEAGGAPQAGPVPAEARARRRRAAPPAAEAPAAETATKRRRTPAKAATPAAEGARTRRTTGSSPDVVVPAQRSQRDEAAPRRASRTSGARR